MSWKRVWKRRARQLKRVKKKGVFSSLFSMDRTRLLARLMTLAFFSLLFLTFFSGLLFAWIAKDLPRPDKIVRREGFATQILDRKGELLYDVYSEEKRSPVDLVSLPQYVKDATIAIEDKDFYKHKGFDFKGIFRAVYNIVVHRRLQGGSTLTQQLVKNVLLTSERTLTRKIKEFILAIQIERKYTKNEILAMYLNESPYGGTAWGIEAAAQNYYGKSAGELTLAETVILVGLPQRPSYYSPFGPNKDAYIWRAQQVLRRMREDGYLDKELEEKTTKELEKVEFIEPGANLKAPHFVMYVKELLDKKYGETLVEKGGLKVTTTLDWELQEEAQKAVAEEIEKVEYLNITNGGAVVIEPQTGEILAMVGSKNYQEPDFGKLNVTLALRQPGSAIKPVTYVTAFKKGYTPSSLIMDTLTSFPGGDKPEYVPVNYDGKEHGPLQVRYALGSSINICAVKMLAKVGIKEMLKTGYEMGISTLEPTTGNVQRLGLSVTLGGGEVKLLEMAIAYSAFANGGKKVESVAILKVEDKDGKVLEEYQPKPERQVITPQEAFLISHILSDNSARLITFGENSLLNISNVSVAVKTGTTNDKKDNWTIGWTPSVLIGVWVGNNDNSSMKEVASGVSGAAPIWRRILLEALKNRPSGEFETPSEVVTAEVDLVSGYRAHDGFSSRVEYFIQGTEPAGEDPIHVKIKVCKSSGKLATPIDISRGEYEEKEYFIFKEDDPTAVAEGPNKWQEGIDNWLKAQSDGRYHPPTEYCETEKQIDVRFKEPAHQSQVGSSFPVKIEAISTHEIETVKLFVNGEEKAVMTSRPYERNLTLPDGTYVLKAEAQDSAGNQGSAEIKIGVNVPWDYSPSPKPSPTLLPSPTLTPSPVPSPTP